MKSAIAIVIGAGMAWLGLLAALLFSEYCLPYQGGGASMLPIAQLFGGTFAAIVAGCTAGIVLLLDRKRISHPPSSGDAADD
jgi:hypothetical protein